MTLTIPEADTTSGQLPVGHGHSLNNDSTLIPVAVIGRCE